MRPISLDENSRSPELVRTVIFSGEAPLMSYSEPSIVWPLRRMMTCCPDEILLQSVSAGLPVKSITATSFVGIWRSCPLTRMVNPTPPISMSCPLTVSPERIRSVAFSCASATPVIDRATMESARIVRLSMFVSSSESAFLQRPSVTRLSR